LPQRRPCGSGFSHAGPRGRARSPIQIQRPHRPPDRCQSEITRFKVKESVFHRLVRGISFEKTAFFAQKPR
jgi:hypothetical protein